MNKFTLSFLLLISITCMSFGQSASKIRGNRDVTIKQTYIDDFSTLIIKNDFEVKLAYNSKTSVEITADDNLHDVIDIKVNAGVLSIISSKRITSKKKLLITVNYSESLNIIELYDDVELSSTSSLELEDLNVKVDNSAEANLNIKSESFKYTGFNKSKSRLNITSDSTSVILNENSKLNTLVNGKSTFFDLNKSSTLTIEGDANDCTLQLASSASFKGKNYTINNANVDVNESADAEVNITTSLLLKATGNSKTYVYGKPKIDLEVFTDTARLQKKND